MARLCADCTGHGDVYVCCLVLLQSLDSDGESRGGIGGVDSRLPVANATLVA